MPKRRREPTPIPMKLDDDRKLELRHEAYRSGVPVAEAMRNYLTTQGMDVASITFDGVLAVAPDFDAELAGLLAYEAAMDEQCGERPNPEADR